jgi:hypothetical protein
VAADRIRGPLQEQRLLLGLMLQPSASLLGCSVKCRSWMSAAAGAGHVRTGRGGGRPWQADPKQQQQPNLAEDGGPPWRRPRHPRPPPIRWASTLLLLSWCRVKFLSCFRQGLGFAKLPGQVFVLMPSPAARLRHRRSSYWIHWPY